MSTDLSLPNDTSLDGCEEPIILIKLHSIQKHFVNLHTSAKLIEIQKSSLQTRHGLHELGSHMESNHTLHGSELGPHWVLGPKNSKFGPMGPKKFAQKFLYTKLVRYHEVTLWCFQAKIVLGAKQVSNKQIPVFTLSAGQKNQMILYHQKVVYVNN